MRACAQSLPVVIDQARSQSPRYPYPAERETRTSGIKRSDMKKFWYPVLLRICLSLCACVASMEAIF